MKNIFIRGCYELCNVDFEKIFFVGVPYWVGFEVLLKSVQELARIDVTKCLPYQHHPIMDYLIVDVIDTYKELVHQHLVWPVEISSFHPLFLHPKTKWKHNLMALHLILV
jgi:hypothetical protein